MSVYLLNLVVDTRSNLASCYPFADIASDGHLATPLPNGDPRRATLLGSAAVQKRPGLTGSPSRKLVAIVGAAALVVTGALMGAPAALAAPPPG